jgi:fermentation-respiration switch protein FrsA (DUF1100 family)
MESALSAIELVAFGWLLGGMTALAEAALMGAAGAAAIAERGGPITACGANCKRKLCVVKFWLASKPGTEARGYQVCPLSLMPSAPMRRRIFHATKALSLAYSTPARSSSVQLPTLMPLSKMLADSV